MKLRIGFISNSSSSSFICQISGEEVCGMDISMYDAQMAQCERGHLMCQSYIEIYTTNKSINEEWNDWKEHDDWRYDFPSKFCPICGLDHILESDALSYLLRKTNINFNTIKQEIKDKFGCNSENFWEYIKNEDKK